MNHATSLSLLPLGAYDIAMPTTAVMSIETAREKLKEAELRCTSSRIAVLQHVAAAAAPVSHSDVADVLVPAGYDKSTIYRCLVELADAGLLKRLDAGDHAWRFEFRKDDDAHEVHPHFMCLDCGKVTCLPDMEIKLADQKAVKNVVGEITEIYLKGHCRQCQ